jgi:hypothetical protein
MDESKYAAASSLLVASDRGGKKKEESDSSDEGEIDEPLDKVESAAAPSDSTVEVGTPIYPIDPSDTNPLFPSMARMEAIKGDPLFAHQRYFYEWIKAVNPRGSLFCMEMGTGKTRPLAMLAKESKAKYVFIIGPGSLRNVMMEELRALGEEVETKKLNPTDRYHFVSSNSGTIYDQWERHLTAIDPENTFDIPSRRSVERVRPDVIVDTDISGLARGSDKAGGEPEIIGGGSRKKSSHSQMIELMDRMTTTHSSRSRATSPKESPHGSVSILIIMDEIHIFSRRVAHILNKVNYSHLVVDPSKNGAYRVYTDLRDADNVQIIGATGTPIPNDAFDLVPLVNILRGKITDARGKVGYALPEKYGDFYFSFVRPLLDNNIDARNLLVSRIRDMIYWYRIPRGLPGIPIPVTKVEKNVYCPMRQEQWSTYLTADMREKVIARSARKEEKLEGIPKTDDKSVYRIFTRQASNFAYPSDFPSGEDKIALLTPEMLTMDAISKTSCKIHAILERVFADNDIHAIFSFFVGDFGIRLIARILEEFGWKSISTYSSYDELRPPSEDAGDGSKVTAAYIDGGKKKTDSTPDTDKTNKPPKAVCYYVLLSGEESVEEKSRLVKILNDPRNASLKRIRVVLYSFAAGHGYTFKSVKHFHCLEPPWSDPDKEQAANRISRLKSAEYLPPAERYVEMLYYIATPPEVEIEEKSKKIKDTSPTESSDQPKPEGLSEGSVLTTADMDISRQAAIKSKKSFGILNVLVQSSVNCRGMFKAECDLSKTLIAKGHPPPTRTFFDCVTCDAAMESTVMLQAADLSCDVKGKEIPKKVEKIEYEGKEYIADRESGLVWAASSTRADDPSKRLIRFNPTIQGVWEKILKK